MRDLLRAASARQLSLPEYEADFYATVETVDGVILKTERAQTFREPGSPSWEAFAAGRWDEALRIAAQPDPDLAQFFARLDERGSGLHRLRIVELPLTPYLFWEFNFLRFRAEAGEQIRVLDAGAVSELERTHGQVPELMVAGSRAVYNVRYDEAGAPVGAEKVVEPEAVDGCRTQILAFLDQAEPFDSFFRREVDRVKPLTALS
ncbi:DUF6879 family protein [Micromonospora sp. AKA38]|uniref:DUF6879 family protein n=1 Tax=Micromonospora sp. AKA38 TaxID=2733861 RepID=UPI0022CAA17D|nr:DUF6879 family protein [Micromonospora sp. AKA38]GHJ18167.1 hypothetical protein TPA0908_61620 [Micromonospora sp. AKA38]